MKAKIYLSDWFYNAGIVGFYRIFKDKEKLEIKDNYIEFDTKELRNFADEYFEYFFIQYNVAERTMQRVANNFKIISQNLTKEPNNKEDENRIKEAIKTQKTYFKNTIKGQLIKIKKFDEDTYETISNAMNKIDEIKDKEQVQELDEIYALIKENLEKTNINQKLTMNFFKSILSNSYFGQPSFLNVVKSSLPYEEQKEVMYKDYISNIIEMDFIKDILSNKYDINEIKEIINKKDQSQLTNQIIKIYQNILKKKDLNQIQEYLKEKALSDCSMCNSEEILPSQYSEGNFIPLAVSSDNMSNFFWNQNVNLQICDICKLILFCIPAGVTSIIKTVKDNGEYKEQNVYSFVNYDTNITELIKTNNNFRDRSKKEKTNYNPYAEIILDIVDQNKQISNWQLENIFVVEFDAEYRAFSRMEYFNITRPVAEFFTKYAIDSLNKIKDYKYRVQVVDYILKNKDTKMIINNRIRDNFTNDIKNNIDSYYATKARMNINLLKKGDKNMEGIEKNNKKLGAIYNIGIATREKFKQKNMENKLDGYIYKMLNCIKQGNKNDFMDIIIRLHISIEESISPIFIESMKEGDLAFEDIGHSYLAGLASNRYEKNEEVENNG